MRVAFKETLKEDRPRERLLKYGQASLSNEELLAIILKTGTKEYDVISLSRLVLSKLDKLKDLQDLNIHELMKIKGMGQVKSLEVLASIELGKRLVAVSPVEKEKLNSARNVYDMLKALFFNKKQEMFYALYLDQKKNLIAKKLLFVGTLNMSIVHPREVFKYAYLNSAAFVICVHNHPSGITEPSIEDIEITQRLKAIGDLQQIYFIDHIIIGDNTYYSFYENGQVIT